MTDERPKRDRSYYAPYDTYAEFDRGFYDWNEVINKGARIDNPYDPNSVQAQAWDRGAEFASYLWWLKRRTLPDDT